MKVYYGHAATEERAAYVTVRGQKATVLPHHVRHSPSGFNWGYNGSGPADLARSILMDAFGTGECASPAGSMCTCEDNKWAEASYPAYRDSVIAKLDQNDDWRLEQTGVTDWVFDYLRASAEVSREEALV